MPLILHPSRCSCPPSRYYGNFLLPYAFLQRIKLIPGMSIKQAQLTTESLRSSSKIDRNHFIRSYIQSQKSFRQAHTKEGTEFQARWNCSQIGSNTEDAVPEPECRSSPILKPRVPSTLDPPHEPHDHDLDPASSSNDNENESAAPKVDSIKAGRNPVKKGSIRATKSTQKNQTTLDQHVEKRGNPAKSRSTKKRQRSDSEVDASM